MCTLGPCKMQINTYRCSRYPDCKNNLRPEGRDQCVTILGTTTAASHVLLRREVTGVALSNGTLYGRLRHYHSQVNNNILSGVIPEGVSPRSPNTLEKLCSIILQLMTKYPPKSLFICPTCDMDGDEI